MTTEFDKPNFLVRPFELDDEDEVTDILKYWTVNRHIGETVVEADELSNSIVHLIGNLGMINTNFWVAADESSGSILGFASVHPLSEGLSSFSNSDEPYEITHNFVRFDYLGREIGTAIIRHIERTTQEKGGRELLVLSGIRYRETSWKFYDKHFGPAISTIDDYYGENAPACIWRQSLRPPA